MTRTTRIALSLSLALVCTLGLFAGCKGTTKSGSSYTVLPNRELEMMMQADLPTIHDKAIKVLRDDFGYKIEKESRDALEGRIIARTARNDKVTVETYKDGDNTTKVQVSAGFLEADYKAREILSQIESSLPAVRTTTAEGTRNNK